MKISFFETAGWEEEFLRKSLKEYTIDFIREPLSKDTLKKAKSSDIISVFTASKLDAKLLKECKKLKMIAARSTGFDNIDLKYCTKEGIIVSNVPNYGENTVAEHTFALILTLSRNIHKAYLKNALGDHKIEGLRGFDLKNKTLGVIGSGRIGMKVIKIARGFEMKVIVHDKNKDTLMARGLGFDYTDIDTLLKNSDIITLHLPYDKTTHHFLNKENMKKIKKGAIIINTARGGLIDSHCLLEMIQKGYIAGAGLDVIEGEEMIKEEKELLGEVNEKNLRKVIDDYMLLKNERVIFTPHIGFYSSEALDRILQTTVDNIISFANKRPINLVS